MECKDESGAIEPLRVHTIVISAQHDPDIVTEEQRRQLKEKIIKVKLCARAVPVVVKYFLGRKRFCFGMDCKFQSFKGLSQSKFVTTRISSTGT